jgi:hypothetical protein
LNGQPPVYKTGALPLSYVGMRHITAKRAANAKPRIIPSLYTLTSAKNAKIYRKNDKKRRRRQFARLKK